MYSIKCWRTIFFKNSYQTKLKITILKNYSQNLFFKKVSKQTLIFRFFLYSSRKIWMIRILEFATRASTVLKMVELGILGMSVVSPTHYITNPFFWKIKGIPCQKKKEKRNVNKTRREIDYSDGPPIYKVAIGSSMHPTNKRSWRHLPNFEVPILPLAPTMKFNLKANKIKIIFSMFLFLFLGFEIF